jgi:pilus assembly protein TadC
MIPETTNPHGAQAHAWARRSDPGGSPRTNVPLGARLMAYFKQGTYQVLGRFFDRREDRQLAARLQQALIGGSPGMYRGLLACTALLVSVGALGIFTVLFGYIAPSPWWWLLAPGLALGVGGLTAVAFPFTLATRIQNRASRLDRELPFSLSELAVLASIGLSPIEMVRKMARREYDPAMTSEFRRVVHKTDIQGKDLITALAETARESASDGVRQTFWDITNMIHQGGDLDQYLRNQSNAALDHKRASQRQFIDQLSTYADMYVTVVLIGVMFLGVGAFLMDAFGTTAGGLPASALLKILTYGLIPLIVFMLGLILATAHQKEGS